MGRARGMAREFQRSMEAAADESGLNEAPPTASRRFDRLHLNARRPDRRASTPTSLVKDIDDAVDRKPAPEAAAAAAGPPRPDPAEPASEPAARQGHERRHDARTTATRSTTAPRR